MKPTHIGIDFGTSTTLVAQRRGAGLATTLPIGKTTSWMPSVAGLDESGCLVFGEAALNQPLERRIHSIKTQLSDGVDIVHVGETEVEVDAIVRGLLTEAVTRASSGAGGFGESARVFVGCPALWTGRERRRFADIANSVGIEVDVADIIDEPVAGGLYAVASAIQLRGRPPVGKLVVFDGGGGTLDVAYLEVADGVRPDLTVLSAEGAPESGDAVDVLVFDDLLVQVDNLPEQDAVRRLLRARATEIKEMLSIDLERQAPLGGGFRHVLSYSRSSLEQVFAAQLARAMKLVEMVVRGAELRSGQMLPPTEIRTINWSSLSGDIKHVVLVGGLSHMPIVRSEIRKRFPTALVESLERPQESVVLGLAMGEDLDRLNLPRPPVDFIVEYPSVLMRQLGLSDWAEQNRYLYQAFTPLYSAGQLFRGESPLGFGKTIPYPPGCTGSIDCTIYAEAPNRSRTRLSFKESGGDIRAGLAVTISSHRPSRFKLYTNGDLVVNDATKERRCRIASWPRIRGLRDGDRQHVVFSRLDDGGWKSSLKHDDWRFQ